jgi:arylsulfatase A-like enzyme
MRMRKFSSGWIWPGLRSGLFAAFVSGILLYLVLLVFFRHLFTNSYDYMLAPILFVSHLSLVFGLMGIVVGLFWRIACRMARRRVHRDDARALCMCTCVAGAAAFFAAAWVALCALRGVSLGTIFGLMAVAAVATGLVWLLYRGILRRLWVSLMPSSRGALALLILSAFGTVLGRSVRSEYLTARPQSYVEGITSWGAPVVAEAEGETGSAGGETAATNRAGGEVAAADSASGDGRLNVLLITIDTLRFDHLGCYGYRRRTTPAVDSLAADGVLFTHAYAQRPKTSPNFACLLTGTYPQRHGVRRTKRPLPGSAFTLAEVLQSEGYATCGVVTNGNLFPAFGFDQGFDEYEYGHGGAQAGTEIALDWLEQGGRGPFFLWVHHTDPHTPYRPPAPYDDVFVDEVEYGNHPLEIVKGDPLGGIHPGLLIEGPLDLDYYISQYDGEIAYTDYWVGKMLEGLRAHGLAQNTLVVFTADHGESLGEHEYYFEHGLLAYDQSARIPLIFSLPGGMGRGALETHVFESVDLMPTVMDLLGMESPITCQGRSVLEVASSLTDPETTGPGRIEPPPGSENDDAASGAVDGTEAGGKTGAGGAAETGGQGGSDRTRLAYIEAGVGHHSGPGYTFAMTDGRYKLVVRDIAWVVRPHHVLDLVYMLNALFEGGAADHELYDLTADPGETLNLLENFPEEAERLRAGLDSFLERMQSGGALPPDTDKRELDEKTLRSLKALGYVN